VRLRSHPWTASDLEAADDLQRRAIEVDLEMRFVSEQRAVRARDDLLAVVSHDLRNPLASILLHADAMLTPTLADHERNVPVPHGGAERIKRAAVHMKSMIDDLLDLASIEAHRFTLHVQPVESRGLVEEAVQIASPLADAKQITVEVELIDTPSLDADPERILRVLSNLLGNAIKFTPRGGTITVRAARLGDDLSITVADTGPGIPAADLPHVFDRYWKASAASSPGTGLGLYIAYGIIEAHGGKIRAESSAGGASFTFTLPLAR
jgi:chemotaxis family two-component system sensor kinase Cph1